jgi:hypothetical protein
MPGVDFNALRNEIPMQAVLDLLRWQATSRSGIQRYGPCPIDDSSSSRARPRSFSVNLEEGRYYCHHCHSHGNPMELWAAVRRMTMYQGAIDLCQALGREVPWIPHW